MIRTLLVLLLLCSYGVQGQLSFEESAAALGVDRTYGFSFYGGGLSFHDFDGDGWDDITYSSTLDQQLYFFKNNGGTFSEVDLGIDNTYETKQVLWVDYDNDGDKDFLATSITGLNKFYVNDGNMNFTDVSETCGLFTDNLYTYGATFGDIDNDGDLDVFISNRDETTFEQHNYLYINENGVFIDITESAGIVLDNELSFCASFFDYDNDGLQDIYVANDKINNINRLYRNRGDLTFEDVSISSGAGIAIDAMSTTIEDYNYDGWLDIYVTNTSAGNYHLRNNGDGTFTNVATELGTVFFSIAWGAVFLDADNDTDLDLYVSGMRVGENEQLPSAFYENIGGSFEIPEGIGFENDNRISFANAKGDVDNDGYPDIIVLNDTEDNFLWKNTTTNNNNWLKVKLEGTTSNKEGIGSTIEVFANGMPQYRYTVCGEGYLGQNSSYEFFGLGDATAIDYVQVKWLSGIVDRIENVDINQAMTVVEGSNAIEQEEDEEEDPVEEELPQEDPVEEEENEELAFEELSEEPPCKGRPLVILPNPSTARLVDLCADFGGSFAVAHVFSMSGIKLKSQTIAATAPMLDLAGLPSGLYLIKLEVGDKVVETKHIKL
ncbi:FG-GAP-like repeat-containing protein [Flagellimonas flava]|uniref:FG-GAP-like repeat-containing protein n=1 Tax=Flagellimonas flava TaxID=570519 RepID=UPI003D65F96B